MLKQFVCFWIFPPICLKRAEVAASLVEPAELLNLEDLQVLQPQEVLPETEVTAHLQLPQPEAAKLADPPDSKFQPVSKAATSACHLRQMGEKIQIFTTSCWIFTMIHTRFFNPKDFNQLQLLFWAIALL